MKIVCLKGGLGNQMFIFSRYEQLRKSGERVFLHRDGRRLKQHGGILVSDCFDTELPSEPWWLPLVVIGLKTLRSLGLWKRLYDDERADCLLIDDYCQNLRFADREVFRFRAAWPQEVMAWAKTIDDCDYPVALHVRRGDYTEVNNQKNFGLCTTDYYCRAMDYVRNRQPHARFFIFSEDPLWCKSHLPMTAECTLVELPPAVPDYASLYLMTRCRGHIIANSTFSFWGARLSEGGNDINIYPSPWFANSQWTAPEIFPADWIKIDS